MKTQDTIRRMADANPVPDTGHLHSDPADVERLFSSIERRRDEMIETRTQPPPSPAPAPRLRPWYRRPAVVFLTAIVAVLVVGLPFVMFTGGGSDVAQTPTPTATVPKVTTTVPATTVPPTTIPSEASDTEPALALAGWEAIKPTMNLGNASRGAFTRVVATESGFVAIGGAGDGIWTSADGVEWTQVGDPSDPVGLGVGLDILDMAVNGDRMAAVISNGWDAVTGIATSVDAENWTFTVLTESAGSDLEPTYPLSIAAYGTDGFIVSGNAIWLSTDGETYKLVHEGIMQDIDPIDAEQNADPLRSGSPQRLDFSASASDGQVAVLGTSLAELLVTQDGETWELIPRLVGVDSEERACSWLSLEALAHGPAGFVAVGGCGPLGTAWTSPHGFVWSQIPYDEAAFGEPAWLHSIAAVELGYVVGGNSGPDGEPRAPTVWTSPDGAGWTRVILAAAVVEDTGVLGVAMNENTLAAVGWIDDEAVIWRAVLAD